MALIRAERFESTRSEAEFCVLTIVIGDTELFLSDIRKALGRTPLSSGDLTQVSVLEIRAFFSFWANHVLWQAGQVEAARGALIELLTLAASLEYYDRSPGRSEFELIGDIMESRAREYRHGIEAPQFSALLSAFQRNLEESTSGLLPDLTIPLTDRPILISDPEAAWELAHFITTDMKYLKGVLLNLVRDTTDFRCLTPTQILGRLQSATRG